LGKTGEAEAQKYLLKENYKILEINFRCRLGEIDIIAQDGEYLVFIEVKTRTSNLFGSPA
jgi:putative endonuclease